MVGAWQQSVPFVNCVELCGAAWKLRGSCKEAVWEGHGRGMGGAHGSCVNLYRAVSDMKLHWPLGQLELNKKVISSSVNLHSKLNLFVNLYRSTLR